MIQGKNLLQAFGINVEEDYVIIILASIISKTSQDRAIELVDVFAKANVKCEVKSSNEETTIRVNGVNENLYYLACCFTPDEFSTKDAYEFLKCVKERSNGELGYFRHDFRGFLNHFLWGIKTNAKECLTQAEVMSLFGLDQNNYDYFFKSLDKGLPAPHRIRPRPGASLSTNPVNVLVPNAEGIVETVLNPQNNQPKEKSSGGNADSKSSAPSDRAVRSIAYMYSKLGVTRDPRIVFIPNGEGLAADEMKQKDQVPSSDELGLQKRLNELRARKEDQNHEAGSTCRPF